MIQLIPFACLYLGLCLLPRGLQSDHARGEAVRMVEGEGEAPPRRGDDELEGRGALVSPTSGGVAVAAAAVVAAGPREEAGDLGRMNPDPREEEDVVDHQTLKYSMEQ